MGPFYKRLLSKCRESFLTQLYFSLDALVIFGMGKTNDRQPTSLFEFHFGWFQSRFSSRFTIRKA